MSTVIFKDDKAYKNIELGAGCGNFGIIFYPNCYLTDRDTTLMDSCERCFIDYFCDAHNLPWASDRFDKIIMCNPYGYGFKDEDKSYGLLDELIRVSKDGCEIIIICNHTNLCCAPKRVKKRIDNYLKPNV